MGEMEDLGYMALVCHAYALAWPCLYNVRYQTRHSCLHNMLLGEDSTQGNQGKKTGLFPKIDIAKTI